MRRVATSLAAAFVLSAGMAGVAHSEGGHDGFNGKAESATKGIGGSFVATSTAFVDPDGTRHDVDTGGRRGPSPYEYQVHRFAGICPNDALGQPRDLVFVDRRLVAAGPTAPWDPASAFCASPNAQPIDLGNIAAQAATVTQSLQPPKPAVRIQPDGTTLVGNPTVFSGAELADVTPPALVNPLSGRSLQLTVHPATWTWDFHDGSQPVTTTGAPPAYRPGSNLAGLLTHTYRKPADLTVTVTVSWTASYTISGIAGVQPVANRVTSVTALPLKVREARSQLVSQ